MALAPDDRLSCPPEVLSRVLDGEAVLLDLGSGTYFGMNEVASRAWELIAKAPTFAEIVGTIVAEFDVDRDSATRDLDAFVEALVSKKLCVVHPDAG